MNKTFNAVLNRDVMDLKNTPKDSISYYEKFIFLLRKHSISRTTLYKELAKETPGEYRSHDYSGRRKPITAGETEKVRKLIFKGKSTNEICKIMSAELGFSYTTRRLGGTKTQIIKESDPENTAGIDTIRTEKNVRKFMYRLSGLDVTDPDRLYALKLGSIKYNVPAGIIKESLDLIAISAESTFSETCGAKDLNDIAKFELKREVVNRICSLRNKPVHAVDLGRLDAIRKKLLEDKPAEHNSADSGLFTSEDVIKTVLYFSPWTKRQAIESFLKKSYPVKKDDTNA